MNIFFLLLPPRLQLKGTYLVVCGKWPTFLAVLATVLVGVFSSYAMELHWLLWPLEAVMILVCSLLLVCLSLFLYTHVTNIPTECPGVVPTTVEGAKAQDPQTSGGSLYHLPPRTHVVSVYCIILLI